MTDNTTETSICGHWCNDITALQVHYGVHVKTLKEQGTNIMSVAVPSGSSTLTIIACSCSTKRPKFNTSPRVKSDLEGHDHGRTISTEEAMRFKNWQADSELGQEFQEKAIRYLASLDHCNMLDLVDAV